MHIVVFHQHYLLPGAGGGARFNGMARAWAAAGHRVSVVAGQLDFGPARIPARFAHRPLVRERDGAVEIWRGHVPTAYGRSYAGRAWAFASFAAVAALAARRLDPADAVIASSPPLTAAWPAALVRGRGGRRPARIFEVRDLWPESAITCGVIAARGLPARALYALERRAVAAADVVVVLTPAFAADLMRRRLAPAARLVCLPNGTCPTTFAPGPADPRLRRRLAGPGRVRLLAVYAGAHGRANDLGQLVAAAQLLRHRPDIRIACVGDGPERAALMAAAAALRLTNLRFVGALPHAAMPAVVRAADVGLAVLADNPTFRGVYPNKIFDYMACARPVLLAIDGAARALVCHAAGAGHFVPPARPEALAAALEAMAADPERRAHMGAAGRAYACRHHDRDAIARAYLVLMERLVGGQTGAGAGAGADGDADAAPSVPAARARWARAG